VTQNHANTRLEKKQNAYKRGVLAESAAGLYLSGKGYKVLKKRHKTRFGEIDLLVEKAGVLVAVEVKARDSRRLAVESVTARSQKRIMRALLSFVSDNLGYSMHDLRCDVVTFVPPFRIQHIENAWQEA
jgi:putative endonuclease